MDRDPAGIGPLPRSVIALFWAVPVTVVLTTLVMQFVFFSEVPENDYWDQIHWLTRIRTDGVTLQELFRQANEHRIAVPRLFFLVDDYFFRSTGWFCVAVMYAGMIGLAGMILRVFRAPLRAADLVGFGWFVVVSLLFLFTQSENFLWENQVQFILVYLLAALAILTALDAEDASGVRQVALHGLTLAVAAAAVFTMANGLLVFGPILLLLAVRRNWPALAVYALAAALLAYGYLHGYQRPPNHPDVAKSIFHVGRLLQHFLMYMGGYFSKTSGIAGGLLGAAGVAYMLERGIRWLGSAGRRPRHESFALLFALYIVGSAALTSLGRADIDIYQGFSSRYQTPVNLFWACIVLLLCLDQRLSLVVRRRVVVAATVALTVLVSAGQAYSLLWQVGHSAKFSYAADAMATRVPDQEAMIRVFPDTTLVLDLADFLEREGRATYVDDRYYRLGRTLTSEPVGALDQATRFDARHLELAKFRGWLLLADVPEVGGRHFNAPVTLADRCGLVIGFGRLFNGRSDVRPHLLEYLRKRNLRLRGYLAQAVVDAAPPCNGVRLLHKPAGQDAPTLNPAALVLIR